MCVPSVYQEGWGGSRWLVGFITAWTTCSRHKNACCIVFWPKVVLSHHASEKLWIIFQSKLKHMHAFIHKKNTQPIWHFGFVVFLLIKKDLFQVVFFLYSLTVLSALSASNNSLAAISFKKTAILRQFIFSGVWKVPLRKSKIKSNRTKAFE